MRQPSQFSTLRLVLLAPENGMRVESGTIHQQTDDMYKVIPQAVENRESVRVDIASVVNCTTFQPACPGQGFQSRADAICRPLWLSRQTGVDSFSSPQPDDHRAGRHYLPGHYP